MITAFVAVKECFNKYLKVREIQTDNVLFRLHCVLTTAILLSASIILTSTQLIGNPIECVSGPVPDKWQKPINTYCWVMGTYLMPEDPRKAYNNNNGAQQVWGSRNTFLLPSEVDRLKAEAEFRRVSQLSPYPGVIGDHESKSPRKHYPYYQWVCFVLFFQAILCYLPKALWKVLEGGLLAKLTTDLHGYCPSAEREKKTHAIISYLQRYRRGHTSYVLMHWGCEVFCLINLVLQMHLMDKFLNGQFFKYGLVFPRMTKCNFDYYGPSGSIVNIDSLCILAQNIINEKIYILLWLWYMVLTLLFCVLLVYRMLLVALPRYRPKVLGARCSLSRSPELFSVSNNLDLGDWWLFYMLAKNINPLTYKELINAYAKSEDGKKRLYPNYQYTTLHSLAPSSKPYGTHGPQPELETKPSPFDLNDSVYKSTTELNHVAKEPIYPRSITYPTAPLPSPPINQNPQYTENDTKESMYSDIGTQPLRSIDTVDFAKKPYPSLDNLDSGNSTMEKRKLIN